MLTTDKKINPRKVQQKDCEDCDKLNHELEYIKGMVIKG